VIRSQMIQAVGKRLAARRAPHPVRVGIDGIDAAGKTSLANELASVLVELDRSVIRSSIDGFHNPAAVRRKRGANSPEGYFLDSFNHEAIVDLLLRPLGPNGSLQFRRAIFDLNADAAIDTPVEHAQPDAILLFDGVFLHREELVQFWDFTIFIDVDFEAALARAERRDVARFGSLADLRTKYLERYIPGQRLYLARSSPRDRATLVIRNEPIQDPSVIEQ
jgi:uridine kinase